MLGRQCPPPQTVPGEAVHREDLRRLIGTKAVHVEKMRVARHGVDARGMRYI
jgi:hypothetical protein